MNGTLVLWPNRRVRSTLIAQEDWLDMPVEQIACYVLGNHGVIGSDKLEITSSLFCGDFEANVQQLTQVRIKLLAALVMAQRVDVLC